MDSNKDLIRSYQNISQREHILLRPGMYVGDMNTVAQSGYIYEDGTFVYKTVDFNEGLVKVVNEVVDNAIDNVFRNQVQTCIAVTVDNDSITVSNDGQHIPIELNADGELIPSVIFGKCLSGSNYDDESGRQSIGLNGIGVKLTNIFSTRFELFIIDPISKQSFKQVWSKNMECCTEPIIRAATKKELKSNIRTKVSFVPDLQRFNVSDVSTVVPFLITRLVEVSATLQENLKIFYNGERVKVRTFKEFVRLFSKQKKLFFETVDDIQFGFTISDEIDGFVQHSFVNNTRTCNGGSHVDLVSNTICKVIQKYFKSKVKNQVVKLSNKNILSKLHVFVNYHMINPEFTSQTKKKLASKMPKIDFNEDLILKSCKKLGILQELELKLNERSLELVEKACSSTKRKNVSVPKLDDAHNAGTSKSTETMLFLTEGDSAKTFCSTGLSVIKRTNYGVFPLKGKILNVRSASKRQLLENKEIQNIIKILGLSLKRSYENDAEIATLRYGKVCILSDADYDGFHISGLFFNFIMHFWPALAQKGFLCRFITPVIKAIETKSKNVKSFFNIADFETFIQDNAVNDYHIKYFKGLGTSTRSEAIEYFKSLDLHLKNITLGPESFEKCDIMFNPKRAIERKQLIVDQELDRLDYSLREMPMTLFINSELLAYSKYSIQRAIPNVIDGLKVSQRKIIFGSLKKFSGKNLEYKVSQLASLVSAQTSYLHGEQSLCNAIIAMAQSYPGSNNLPLLSENGSFGSRLQNGKDCASARYIFTNLKAYTRNIFVKEDDPILRYKKEEGIQVEPQYYYPTIPLVLCNGSNGISTGFRTEIPMFNVEQIIQQLICKCKNREYEFVNLVPYYKGYKGTVKMNADGKYTMYGSYIFEKGSKTCIVTEIPICYSLESYKDRVLDRLVEEGHIGTYSIDHVSENEPRFVLKNLKSTFDASLLRLDHTLNVHLVLLNAENIIQTYNGTTDIMNAFFTEKLKALQRRKTWLIENINDELFNLNEKRLFIKGVINKDIDIECDVNDIQIQCLLLGITGNVDSFMQLSLLSLTKNKVNELDELISKKQCDLDHIMAISTHDMYLNDLKALHKTMYSKNLGKRKRG